MADRNSENGDEQFNICTKIQLSGVLMKRPFGHQSSKWSKRFFVVKEGFLLYYNENEKKVFEKRGYFNIHPKGVIPLGGCIVEPVTDLGQNYAIHVKSEEFNNGIVALAAENCYEREKWIQTLQEASRITWKNTQLGEAIIQQLETQGLQLSKERQDYFDKLQEETMALRDEMDKNEELERVTAELDKEKRKLEHLMLELKHEHENSRRDYEETIQALKSLHEDKLQLQNTTDELQHTLQELALERERTLTALRKQEEENCKLTQTHDELQITLKAIEEETKQLLEEKQEIEQRFVENEIHAQMLAEEKKLLSDHALNLQSSLQDLLAQKVLTETELKEEILARIDAEKHLKMAEDSLHHLEILIRSGSGNISENLRDEILPDVKRLKKFFEDVAEEAKIDANKPIIMKNAVLARKKYAQLARSQRIQSNRSEKAKSLGIILDDSGGGRGLRRSLSTIVTERAQVTAQLNLRRSRSTRTVNSQLSKRTSLHTCRADNCKANPAVDVISEESVVGKSQISTIIIDGCKVQTRRKLSVVGESEA